MRLNSASRRKKSPRKGRGGKCLPAAAEARPRRISRAHDNYARA